MNITDQQIQFLENEISNRGVSFPGLAEDLLDHFCCAIEAERETGLSFEEAYRKVYFEICPNGPAEIEYEMKLVVTQNNYSVMKKVVFILGFLAAIIFNVGYFFKIMHWPTANVQIMLGSGLFGMIFLPAYYVLKYLSDKDLKQAAQPLVYLLNCLLVSLIVLAVPYAFLKLPGSAFVIATGFGLFTFVFLPKVFLNWYKKFEQGGVNPTFNGKSFQ